MRIHDTGPTTDAPYTGTDPTIWGFDYGTHGHIDRQRPIIDDESRPARDLERNLDRWGPAVGRAWSMLTTAFRRQP